MISIKQLQLYQKRVGSHFVWFQQDKAEEEEFQGGSSVPGDKGRHGGLKSLWDSNILPHRVLSGHPDQSCYSRSQPHRVGGMQSPKDNRSLKNSHGKYH